MKFAVELFFDPITDASVRGAWDAVQAATGVSYMQTSGAHPHVALTVFESASLSTPALIDEVAKCSIPSKLKPAGLGSFNGGVAFVAIEAQAELLLLQKRVVDLCFAQNADLWDYYTAKKWVPHCTLMQNLPPDQIDAACRAISPSIFQCPWEVRSVCLITFPPTTIVEERMRPKRAPQ